MRNCGVTFEVQKMDPKSDPTFWSCSKLYDNSKSGSKIGTKNGPKKWPQFSANMLTFVERFRANKTTSVRNILDSGWHKFDIRNNFICVMLLWRPLFVSPKFRLILVQKIDLSNRISKRSERPIMTQRRPHLLKPFAVSFSISTMTTMTHRRQWRRQWWRQ